MTIENIITILKRDLIRAFAALDGWFDKDQELLTYKVPGDHTYVHDILKQIMLSNKYMLSQIDDGCNEAISRAKINGLDQTIKEYILGKLEFQDPDVYKFFMHIYQEQNTPADTSPLHSIRLSLRDHLDQCLCHLELMKNGEGAMFTAALLSDSTTKIDMYQWIHLLTVHINQQIEKLVKIELVFNEQLNNK